MNPRVVKKRVPVQGRKEDLFVAGFDGVAKWVFAFGISKCDKLPILSFYALWVDGTDVIADGQFVVLAMILDGW